MQIPIRCYAVISGANAGDPLAVELVRATDRVAADSIAATMQAHARRGAMFGLAQYFVREVDADLDLPVSSAAEAVAQGYSVRATVGDSPLVVGAAGAATDHLEIARRREERAAQETLEPEPEVEPGMVEIAAPGKIGRVQ